MCVYIYYGCRLGTYDHIRRRLASETKPARRAVCKRPITLESQCPGKFLYEYYYRVYGSGFRHTPLQSYYILTSKNICL